MAIALGVRSKVAGEAFVGESVELLAMQDAADDMLPYERLLGDAMDGDATLFARQDSVEAQWRVVDPILGDAATIASLRSRKLGTARVASSHRPAGRLARSEGRCIDRRRMMRIRRQPARRPGPEMGWPRIAAGRSEPVLRGP